MLTFAVEQWADIRSEIAPLWAVHHVEVADPIDTDIPLDPDVVKYTRLADQGHLHIVAARANGALVGYCFVIIDTHLHYRTLLCGMFDIYWLAPAHRGHWHGIRMMRAVERSLRARGVRKAFSGTKLWLDASAMFKRLGWRPVENLFTKRLD